MKFYVVKNSYQLHWFLSPLLIRLLNYFNYFVAFWSLENNFINALILKPLNTWP